MHSLKNFSLLQILYQWILMYPTPVVSTYLWNFGSLAGLALVIQIVSGVASAMWYVASAHVAFASAEFVMREVPWGWFICYLPAIGASFFVAVVAIHMGRGLCYSSYT